MISVRKVKVQVLGGPELVHEVSLELSSGQMIGVYGPNGSGKTCLLKTLSAENKEHLVTGEVWVEQKPILQSVVSAQEKANTILYLGSDFYTPFQVTVRELLELAKQVNAHSKENVASIAEDFRITPLLNRSFHRLSDGEKQAVMIARGIIQAPRWLVLDETFSKIDLDRSFVLGQRLKEKVKNGMGMIVASHDLNLLSEFCDDLWLMKDGSILTHGGFEETLTTENLNLLYPERTTHVVRSPESGKKKVIY